ncbi:MAG: serine hydrolase [Gemmatimonadetes bacterium]|nr:serine hydrolase [Gemmatimonadota bacterium]
MRPLRQLQPVLLAAILVVASASPAAAQSLDAYVTGQLGQLSAKTSIYAKHLPSGRTIAVRADVPMNTLSVIKIPVMILAFRDAEAGKLDLTARYTIRP